MNAIDLYCGVGGMSLGFKRSGFNIIGAYEIDKRHCKSFSENFPKTNIFNKDITILEGQDLYDNAKGEEIDVIFGGPPCQGFSNGGKQNLDDIRNNQILHFAGLVAALQPKIFVMENVLGILNSKFDPLINQYLELLMKNNFKRVERFVLDASKFNVPQKRRRVFFIGFRDGVSEKEFKIRQVFSENKLLNPTVKDAIYDMRNINLAPNTSDIFTGNLKKPSTYSSLLRRCVKEENDHKYFRNCVKHLSGCMTTNHSKEVISRFKKTNQNSTEAISRYKRLDWDGQSPTLRAGTIRGRGQYMAPRPIHPIFHRCITTREAARLHSFPDWFQFYPTKWYGMMQIGNSVPPFLSEAVSSAVFRHLN